MKRLWIRAGGFVYGTAGQIEGLARKSEFDETDLKGMRFEPNGESYVPEESEVEDAVSTNTTFEVCPHCECEVELDATLGIQVCPECGKHIVTCSMCIMSSEGKCTSECPLEYLANKLNEGK